jgi:hypothetical protein
VAEMDSIFQADPALLDDQPETSHPTLPPGIGNHLACCHSTAKLYVGNTIERKNLKISQTTGIKGHVKEC